MESNILGANGMTIEAAEPIFYPLTHAQQRIWYAELTYPGTTAETFVYTVRWETDLDFSLLTEALNQVIAHNGPMNRFKNQNIMKSGWFYETEFA